MSFMKSYALIMAGGLYAALLSILYLTVQSGALGPAAPLSVSIFIDSLFNTVTLIITVVAIADALYYLFAVLPVAIKVPSAHTIGIFFPTVISVMGFIIALLNANFYLALPYFALSAACTLYGYSRISEISG